MLPAVVAISALSGTAIGGIVLATSTTTPAPAHPLITRASWGDGTLTSMVGTGRPSALARSSGAASSSSFFSSAPPMATSSPTSTAASSSSPSGGPLLRDGAQPSGTAVVAAGVETVDMPGASGDVADDSAIFRNPDHPEHS